MTLSEELSWRGFVNQTTYGQLSDIDHEPITFYWGVDPSASSMTIGNLAIAMMVRHFLDYGHKAVLLVGGATGMIGDPDGKKQERDLLTPEKLVANKKGIASQYKTIFADKQFELVDNYEWFQSINYLDFLRDIGKHVSMTQMLSRDFVQSRIGEGGDGISYAEFSYSLIQGYDFLHLYRNHGVTLQLAGADQWGNSISGVHLVRKLEAAEAHVWTAPLIVNKATGMKFGKSEGGAIWLDESLTSPYQYYQFWLNVDDQSGEDLIKIYTLLDKSTIEDIIAEHRVNPGARLLQKTLAREATSLIHGVDRCHAVERVTTVLFGGEPIDSLNTSQIEILAQEISTQPLNQSLQNSLVAAGAAASQSDARRLIAGGAISVNHAKVTENIVIEKTALIKKGKNTYILVR